MPSPSRLFLLIGAVALAIAVGGCGPKETPKSAGEKGLTKVMLQTDWFAEPEHGGFYEALAKGYYRDAGLDVQINQGNPSTHPDEMVATGRADFAIGRTDYVLTEAARGIPLIIVGALMQHDPQAIMVHHESGIRSLKDLDHHAIMAVPGSPFIAIMQNTLHMQMSVIPSDFGMSRFLADPNFAQQCFLTNEPYYVRKHGANTDVLPISACGFDPYRAWYCRKDFASAHPDIVRAFCEASLKGWRDYIGGDPVAANTAIAALNPKMDPEFMTFSLGAMKEYKLVAGDPAAGEYLGQITKARIALELKQLRDIGLLDQDVTVGDVFDDRFVPPPPSP